MRKFIFRMEKLLEIKSFAEKERSLELAEVTNRYIRKKNDIKQLFLLRREILSKRFDSADKNITVDSVFFDTQFSAVKEKIVLLERDLSEISREREKVREKYIQALKEKKGIEKLKEKKMDQHRKTEMRKEEKTLDDISVTSYTVKLQEV